jgi:hypothetical protein
MSIFLKNDTDQAEAASSSYTSAAILCTINNAWKPAAQATFRHTGTSGFWYIKFKRTTGPTTTVYSIKLGPGEFFTEDNPPIGEVWALASGGSIGALSWYIGGKV